MPFTEFSYQLLQAHDFHKLYEENDCILQIGGSDQWGNIIAGADLITHLEGLAPLEGQIPPEVFGLTTPLLLGSHGKKMGKTADNSIWLDPEMTSPFDFYQVTATFLNFPRAYPHGSRF
jgi:tyrosyl-tRNA synthetase